MRVLCHTAVTEFAILQEALWQWYTTISDAVVACFLASWRTVVQKCTVAVASQESQHWRYWVPAVTSVVTSVTSTTLWFSDQTCLLAMPPLMWRRETVKSTPRLLLLLIFAESIWQGHMSNILPNKHVDLRFEDSSLLTGVCYIGGHMQNIM